MVAFHEIKNICSEQWYALNGFHIKRICFRRFNWILSRTKEKHSTEVIHSFSLSSNSFETVHICIFKRISHALIVSKWKKSHIIHKNMRWNLSRISDNIQSWDNKSYFTDWNIPRWRHTKYKLIAWIHFYCGFEKKKKFIENPYTKLCRIRTQSLIPIFFSLSLSLSHASKWRKKTSEKNFFSFIASSVGYYYYTLLPFAFADGFSLIAKIYGPVLSLL